MEASMAPPPASDHAGGPLKKRIGGEEARELARSKVRVGGEDEAAVARPAEESDGSEVEPAVARVTNRSEPSTPPERSGNTTMVRSCQGPASC